MVDVVGVALVIAAVPVVTVTFIFLEILVVLADWGGDTGPTFDSYAPALSNKNFHKQRTTCFATIYFEFHTLCERGRLQWLRPRARALETYRVIIVTPLPTESVYLRLARDERGEL